MGRRAIGILVRAGMFGLAAAARLSAQSGPLAPGERLEWNALAGYGQPTHLHSPSAKNREVYVEPGVGIRLSSRTQLLVNAHFEQWFSPGGYVAGVLPLGARFYVGRGPVYPYVGLQTGLSWTNLHVVDFSRRFNFLVQGSLGVRRRFSSGPAWIVEARFSHISNAGTVYPNFGHNGVGLLVGAAFR